MDSTQKMYKIGEFAKLTGLSVPTLRYYDEIGLLSPEVKRLNGYRLYAGRQLFQTQFISNMKSAGLSLEDIRYLMEHPQPESILPKLEALHRKLETDLRQISSLEKYFRIGKEHAAVSFSAENMERSTLPATHALYTEIEELHAEGIFAYHAQILQKNRDQFGFRQTSGMRIVLYEASCRKKPGENRKNLLICPVDPPETEIQREQVRWFPKKKTISCILQKNSVSYEEELLQMRQYLQKEGIQEADAPPVAEGLLDPGDLAGRNLILVRLHLAIQ